MPLHAVEDGVLHRTLPCDLEVTTRAAAPLEAQALIYAHRPPTRPRAARRPRPLTRLTRGCRASGAGHRGLCGSPHRAIPG